MKNFVFAALALVLFAFNGNAQDKFSDGKYDLLAINYSKDDVNIRCKKFTVGVNVLVAYVETEVYIACGFPVGSGIGGGTCMVVSEEFCNTIKVDRPTSSGSKYINIKNLISDKDLSKVEFIEITKSTTWIDEENNSKSTIELGKYAVDKLGNFEVKIVTIK